jgi:uncharacterized membrane protein
MIISNNNPTNNKNNYNISNSNNHYKDINNTKESIKEAYNILEDRYHKGLISLDEFNKKCNQLNIKANKNK